MNAGSNFVPYVLAGTFAAGVAIFLLYLVFDGEGAWRSRKGRLIFVALAAFVCFRAFYEAFNPAS